MAEVLENWHKLVQGCIPQVLITMLLGECPDFLQLNKDR